MVFLRVGAIVAVIIGVAVIGYGVYGLLNVKDVTIAPTAEFTAPADGELFVYVDGNVAYSDTGILAGEVCKVTCSLSKSVSKKMQTMMVETVFKSKSGSILKIAKEEVNISDGDIFFVSLKLVDPS